MLPLAPLLKIYNMLISAILKQDFFYRSGLISNQMTHWFKTNSYNFQTSESWVL